MSFLFSLFLVLASALIGGVIARKLKFQPVVGYILAGVVVGNLFSSAQFGIEKLAEIGAVLLLFSIGLELSLTKFSGMFRKIFIGASLEILLVTLVLYFVLKLLGLNNIHSLILAIGFSLSSTAVIIKILADRGEIDTIHGKLMIGWLLVQDMAVVPIMVILPVLKESASVAVLPIALALLKALGVVFVSFVVGKVIAPFVIHRIAELNSRELLVVTSVALALGTAYAVSLLGINPALGAFLAGLVIAESQENHAVFAETRPLRDLFVALFFVTLGFLVNLSVVFANFDKVVILSLVIILVKFLVITFIGIILKAWGKTLVYLSLGLSQVGEFAFVVFSTSVALGILPANLSSLGISASLLSLLITPFIFKNIIPIWRLLKNIKFYKASEKNLNIEDEFSNHIVICGFGRVGGWVGKALEEYGIPFIVIEFDQSIVNDLKKKGIPVIYGDPSEPEVLDLAFLKLAKAIVVAIPDRLAQETLITHIQTVAPNVRIISRVHLDEDYEKLKSLRVDKLVQPEFEAATSIVRSIFISMGKDKETINKSIKNLRLSHAKI